MTNIEVLNIAMEQSAKDIGCSANDFRNKNNVVIPYELDINAKKYYSKPLGANFISYGNNIVVGAVPPILSIVEEYIGCSSVTKCFEMPTIHILDSKLDLLGYKVWLLVEYHLLDLNKFKVFSCDYDMLVLGNDEIKELYLPEWSNALCSDRKQLNNIAVGAYDGDKLIGIAGCTEDAEKMWQIGVDVLPEYRRQGVASALITRLAKIIMDNNKIPFYCCAWSNISSKRTALKCGFYFAWIEMYVKPKGIVDKMLDI